MTHNTGLKAGAAALLGIAVLLGTGLTAHQTQAATIPHASAEFRSMSVKDWDNHGSNWSITIGGGGRNDRDARWRRDHNRDDWYNGDYRGRDRDDRGRDRDDRGRDRDDRDRHNDYTWYGGGDRHQDNGWGGDNGRGYDRHDNNGWNGDNGRGNDRRDNNGWNGDNGRGHDRDDQH